MGEASSFVAVRLMRIVPIAAIILASFYIFNTCFAAFQATDVPVPEEWKKHDVVMEEESLETITVTLTGYPDSTPTPHVLTIAEIEELENKGDITGFSDEDEDEDDIYLNLDDEDDWTEEGLRKEMVIGEGEEFPSENDEGDEGVEKGDDDDGVDWSRFAYIQYVTNEDYLCNSVMIFEALHRLGSKADRLLMYPKEMLVPDAPYSKTHGGQLLIRARDEYNVTLQPIEIQHRDGQDGTLTHIITYTAMADSA